MKPSTWKKPMPETAMNELAWRLDPVGAHAAPSENFEATKTTPVPRAACAANVSAADRSRPAGLFRRCNDVVRTWVRERLNGLVSQSADFEEILHEFTETIETADSAGAVEAVLLRQARRAVPASRVELIMGPAPSYDQRPHILAVDGGTGGGVKPIIPGSSPYDQSVLEVPVCCGSGELGRLRIRSRARGIASLRKETIRRLSTLCRIGACAIQRLDQSEAWPGEDDLAMVADSAGAGLTSNADRTGARFVATTRLHDATFLNAVLPFALNQARRHNEPLSLVCVAIDRLSGIQQLLGPGTADLLVRSVAETVAGLIRTSDIVARLDDDRVVAVLPRAPGGGALHVAQRICEVVANKGRSGGEIPKITVSIGVATFPACAGNVFSLFDAADEALGRAQGQGRNQACIAPRRSARAPVQPQPATCP
jgi:diguanylate cyclase (GGDEF)-like protein